MAARVILLAGPSGSGKSRLATRSGLPILQLDDFYRSGGDPALPRFATGEVDWDDARSWHADRALDAIRALCSAGEATVPIYDIAANGPSGAQHLRLDGAARFVAEGIFAAELVASCRIEGSAGFCDLRPPVPVDHHAAAVPTRLGRAPQARRLSAAPRLVPGPAGTEQSSAELEAKGCVCRTPRQVERYLRPVGS